MSNPFYIKDQLTSQLDKEDDERRKQKLIFMKKQQEDYQNYMKMKEQRFNINNINKNNDFDRLQTPIKLNEDKNYKKIHKNIDTINDDLCTNITNDNMYARQGYVVKPWKIQKKYQNNQINEKVNRNLIKKKYNIINNQSINDVKDMIDNYKNNNNNISEKDYTNTGVDNTPYGTLPVNNMFYNNKDIYGNPNPDMNINNFYKNEEEVYNNNNNYEGQTYSNYAPDQKKSYYEQYEEYKKNQQNNYNNNNMYNNQEQYNNVLYNNQNNDNIYYNQEQYNNNIPINNNQEIYNNNINNNNINNNNINNNNINNNNNKRAITPNFKLYNINKNEYKNYLANRNYDNYYEEENNEYENNNNYNNNNNISPNEQNYSNIPNNNNYSNIPDNNNYNNNNNYNDYIANNEEYQKYISNKKMLEEFQKKNNNNNLYNEVSNNINNNYSYHNNINNNNINNFHPQELSPKYVSNSNYVSKYSQNNQQQQQQPKNIPPQKIIPQEQIYNNYLQSIEHKGDLPFDNIEENSYEYIQNKKKNIATYANLTHTTTLTPSLKVIPSNSYKNMDEEKLKELNLKREKIRKYKESLDLQIKNRPKSAYRPFNNDRRIEVPPDPFVEHGYKIKNNF